MTFNVTHVQLDSDYKSSHTLKMEFNLLKMTYTGVDPEGGGGEEHPPLAIKIVYIYV